MANITPYDGKVAVWLVHSDDVAENSIDELARTLLTYAPAVSAIWVKTNDGADWMSQYDHKPSMWIDGPAAIDKWVNTLQKYGLEFHAWCVPRGLDIEAEAAIITQVCQRPGVRSMILDVEPYQGFYAGAKETVRPLMTKIRSALPGTFHIGMSVDSRSAHFDAIFPHEWYPFVSSIHPQVYWADFGTSPQAALTEAYATWGSYGYPVIPALSGFNTDPALMDAARTMAINTEHAPGLSWWAFGHIDVTHFISVNYTMTNKMAVPAPGSDGEPVSNGAPIVVTVGSPNYADGVYDPSKTTFGRYQGANGIGKYRPVNANVANVYASWSPHIKQAGWYHIEAYVPNQHATTGDARYKIHGIKDQPDEYLVSAAQSTVSNGWMTLGTFQIDPTRPQPGAVYLGDWTFELNREIAFDAIRWTPVTSMPTAPALLIDVPYRSQEDPDARRYRNDCGPACVAMYIDWLRQKRGQPAQPVSIDQLASETTLAQSDQGLYLHDLVPIAANHGVTLTLNLTLTFSAVLAELNAGRPPLVLIAYGPLIGRENQADASGHFVIVTGYDADHVYVNDPDWWNQGSVHREQGHNWQIPITQFKQAMAQSPGPNQGCVITV